MIRALYTATSGMLVEARRLDLAARNLYYGMVPGYRGAGELRQADRPTASAVPTDIQTRYAGEFVDAKPGAIQPTGRALDLALEGDGLFAVETPAGVAYTRAGRFYRARDGVVRNGNGFALLGEDGPIQIPDELLPPGVEIRVDEDGTVRAGGEVVGRLLLRDFPGFRGLRRVQGTLFIPTGAAAPVPAKARVLQKSLEQSNVQIVEQMVRTIEAVRAFEAYQKVITTVMEEVTAESVRRLGRVA